MKRAVLYLRVSTQDQTTANQERELRDIAGRMGVEIIKVYKDHGISGAKGRDRRPQFDALCRDAAKRQFDVIMAWSVDRLGRSLQDLVGFLGEIHALKVDLYLHQQGIDTRTPAGKAMFQMMGVFAEFERAMIRERVNAGLKRARAEGRIGGRPRIAPALEERIKIALDEPDRVGGLVRVILPNSRYSSSGTRHTPPTNLQWVSRRSAAATTARAIPYCSRPRMGISWRPASTRRSATGSSRLTVGGRPSRAVSPGSASRYARTRSPAAGRGTAPGSNTSPASHGTAAAAG